MKNIRKHPKKNNAHLVNKDDLAKQAREMEMKLIRKESRRKNGKDTS